ncbi:hypothetical protein QJS04_geneDACA013734 [Acorus gramineus]|uniref:Uncharacterized protein n=1 Tax=Acorus gramineus TaxID=55184 RepID=A0AAV9B0Y8_ACOGR|nr:hypothetical protein QJS04_geneDACA013734 [Acorus gramineus]
MENVRILRRGEKPQNAALAVDRRTDGHSKKIASVNLEPSPSIISPASVDRRSDGSESAVLFAGSVSVNSPPPNSLPIPKFLGRGLTCPIRDNILALLRLDLGSEEGVASGIGSEEENKFHMHLVGDYLCLVLKSW